MASPLGRPVLVLAVGYSKPLYFSLLLEQTTVFAIARTGCKASPGRRAPPRGG
ncbi:MAG: hypothetical protein PUP91_24110 [Rhizonema sp. PD37]|nr:hypothetical protein [Rhizonema sp. PD37]